MTSCASLTREKGLIPFQSTSYWASIPKLPQEMTPSARPPVSSSRVASAWQMSVGSRRYTLERLGPKRTLVVLSAAAA